MAGFVPARRRHTRVPGEVQRRFDVRVGAAGRVRLQRWYVASVLASLSVWHLTALVKDRTRSLQAKRREKGSSSHSWSCTSVIECDNLCSTFYSIEGTGPRRRIPGMLLAPVVWILTLLICYFFAAKTWWF